MSCRRWTDDRRSWRETGKDCNSEGETSKQCCLTAKVSQARMCGSGNTCPDDVWGGGGLLGYFSLCVGGEEGWGAKSQGRASESAKRSLVEMAEALLFPSLFRRREAGGQAVATATVTTESKRCRKSNGKDKQLTKTTKLRLCQVVDIGMEGRGGCPRMARVENATAPLPYSAISGTGGSAGAPTAVGVGVALSGVLPAARCPRMRMRMQWEEPCCKTGPRPAKTRGWQPAAGLRAHGTNQLHSFFAERNSCPSDREQARNSELWAAMPLSVPVPGLIFPRR